MASSKRFKKRPLSLSLSQSTAPEPSRIRKKCNMNRLRSDVTKDEFDSTTSRLSVVSEEDKDNPKRRLVEKWLEEASTDPDAVDNVLGPDESSQDTVFLEHITSPLPEVDQGNNLAESASVNNSEKTSPQKCTPRKGLNNAESASPARSINITEVISPQKCTPVKRMNLGESASLAGSINVAENTSPVKCTPSNRNHAESNSELNVVKPAELPCSTENVNPTESIKQTPSTGFLDAVTPTSPLPTPIEEEDEEPLLQCPLCWKNFEKTQCQTAHLKACGAANGLTTRQLIDAVDLHKKQLAERKRLGLPSAVTPHHPQPAPAKKVATRKARPPKDSNLQLALALSLSLAQEGQQREERQEALTNFGFTTKQNGARKSAPVLLTRTQAERERLITEKVAIVLMDDAGGSQRSCNSAEACPAVHSTQLQEWCNKQNPLWKKSHSSPSQTDSCTFYVGALGGVIAPSEVEPGAKLRHLSQVPGRMNTPEKQAPKKPEEKARERSSSSEFFTPTNVSSLSKLEQEIKAKHLSDWASMLKNNTMSDLSIYVRGGLSIPAHKLIFAVRCPDVLRHVTQQRNPVTGLNVDVILWSEISNNAAVCFLEYLYYGSIRSVHTLRSDMSELHWLADQYQATDLLYALAYLKKKKKKKCKRTSETPQRRRRLLSDGENEVNEPATAPSPEKLPEEREDGNGFFCCRKTPDGKKTPKPAMELQTPEKTKKETSSPGHVSIYSGRACSGIDLIHSPDPFAEDSVPPSPTSDHQDQVLALSQSRRKTTTDDPPDIHSISTGLKSATDDDEAFSPKLMNGSSTATVTERTSNPFSSRRSSGSDGISISRRKSPATASTKRRSDSNVSTLIRRFSRDSSLKTDSEAGQASNHFELRLSSGSSQGGKNLPRDSGNKDSSGASSKSFSSTNLPRFNSKSPQRIRLQLSDDDDVIILSDDETAAFTQKEPTVRLSPITRPSDFGTTVSPKKPGSPQSSGKETPYISPIWSGFEDVQYNIDTNHDWNEAPNDEIPKNRVSTEPKRVHDISSSSDSSGTGKDNDVCIKMLDDSMNAILASSILERAVSESEASKPSPERTPAGCASPDSGRVTPMKDYNGMTTPDIKTELKKFGLKPALGRRKGVLMLEHIYNELHPWVPVGEKNCLVDGADAISTLPQQSLRNPIPSSQTNSCSSSSFSSTEDGFSEADGESADSDSAVTMSQRALHKLSPANLPDVVKKHIEKDPVLHRKILEYQPIFIENLQSDLKTCGYKVKITDLMAYLAEKCINYRSTKPQGRGKRKREQNDQPRRKPRLDLDEDT